MNDITNPAPTADHASAIPQPVADATAIPTTDPLSAATLADEATLPMIPLAHVQGYVNSGIGLTIHKLRPTPEEFDALITLIAEFQASDSGTLGYAASVAQEFVDRLHQDQSVTMTSAELVDFDSRFDVQVTNLKAPVSGFRFRLVERHPADQATLKAGMIAADTLEA